MMKYIFSLIGLIFLSYCADAQTLPKDSLTGKFVYTAVISVDDVNQDELLDRATKWVEWKYDIDSSGLKNETGGRISYNGNFATNFSANGYTHEMYVLYTVSINVEDGKYVYEITDLSFKPDLQLSWSTTFESYDSNPTTADGVNKNVKSELFRKTDGEVKKMIGEIKSAMSGSIPTKY